MDLPDVNVLINAHREDAPDHEPYAEWLTSLAKGSDAFAVSSVTLGGFLRIVTNPRIFEPATPMDVTLNFCRELAARRAAVFIQPGARHWSIMSDLIERSGESGATVSDAYLAALAIEHGCEVVTSDRDFARFSDVRWRYPLT